jgi:thiosulfate/3-mercaptopyruvate sulfurtransferase
VQRFLFGLLVIGLVVMTACSAATPAQVPSSSSGANDYAAPALLADTGWLESNLSSPKIRIVDMRSAEKYQAGHIPGAVRLDGGKLKDPDEKLFVTRPELFAKYMGELGIGPDTTVVAYDDQGGLWPTRLWWVLDYYGHTNAQVLNGGWNKWTKEGRATSTDTPAVSTVSFTPKITPGVYCDVDDLTNAIEKPDMVIVDARSAAEYGGTDVRAARGGHVPGAVNIDWQRNVTNDDLKVWKPAPELRQMYESAGVTKDKQIITYCQTAVRAAHTFFTLRLIGYGQVMNYDGSWAEWGNRTDLPIKR